MRTQIFGPHRKSLPSVAITQVTHDIGQEYADGLAAKKERTEWYETNKVWHPIYGPIQARDSKIAEFVARAWLLTEYPDAHITEPDIEIRDSAAQCKIGHDADLIVTLGSDSWPIHVKYHPLGSPFPESFTIANSDKRTDGYTCLVLMHPVRPFAFIRGLVPTIELRAILKDPIKPGLGRVQKCAYASDFSRQWPAFITSQ